MSISQLVNSVEDNFGRTMLSIDDVTRSVPNGCVPQVALAVVLLTFPFLVE